MKQRNEAIDILKGIGIILVLTAHSLEGFLSQFAYTFHMPLFFIVTGLFISEANEHDFDKWWKATTKKDFKRLLLPALFSITIILAISSLSYFVTNSFLQNPVSLIWNEQPNKPFEYIKMLGNLWFLFALFFAKQSFYLTRYFFGMRYLPFCCLLLGALIVVLSKYIILPLGLSIGISVLPFIWCGYYLKHHGGADTGVPKWFYVSILTWAIYILFGKMRVGTMTYSWGYLPDIIAACGGTLAFYQISKGIERKTTYIRKILSFLGVYSLILICAPSIETYCFPIHKIMPVMPLRSIFVIVGKVGWCALALYACIKIPLLRKIFGVK